MKPARNALLLTLILDGKHNSHGNEVWEIYYHFKLSPAALALLHEQASKLHALSSTLTKWCAESNNKYNTTVQFCDEATLASCRDIWAFYADKSNTSALTEFFAKANQVRSAIFGNGGSRLNLTGIRSTVPALQMPDVLSDTSAAHAHYWQHGTTSTLRGEIAAVKDTWNPCFAVPDQDTVLHYGIDALLGFHLATAYAPLVDHEGGASKAKNNKLGTAKERKIQKLADVARHEFGEWCFAFGQNSADITVRFFAGDALAFGHLLQAHKDGKAASGLPCVYKDRFHFTPAVLNATMYGNGPSEVQAPRKFDVIDTSNLADHVGALNLLTAVRPLLRDESWASISTETLLRFDGNPKEALSALLCGELQTISLLLSLVLVDSSTNTTSGCLAEFTLSELIQGVAGAGQQLVKLLWKQPLLNRTCDTAARLPTTIKWKAQELAQVLRSVYYKMFTAEDFARLASSMSIARIQRRNLPNYQRASFAAFLRLVHANVDTDWKEAMDILLDSFGQGNVLLTGRQFWQELSLWLHVLGLYTVRELRDLPAQLYMRGRTTLHKWTDMPKVVAVTLRVPRKHLSFYTASGDMSRVSTPPVMCSVSNTPCSKAVRDPTQLDSYAAVQIGFGNIRTRGQRHSRNFEVHVEEDPKGWSGDSDLLVSFLVPAWSTLTEPDEFFVCFRLSMTPANAGNFTQQFGMFLVIFEASSQDSQHVYLSRALPELAPLHGGISSHGSDAVRRSARSTADDAVYSICASASEDSTPGEVTSLVSRVDIQQDTIKKLLQSGCDVKSRSVTPFISEITLSSKKIDDNVKLLLDFPVPVVAASVKTRIARKSSYIELEANMTKVYRAPTSFRYPVVAPTQNTMMAMWNMPRVNFSKLPLIDAARNLHSKLGWLTQFMSMQWSNRERFLRGNPAAPATAEERVLCDMKESLFTMAMHFTGLQGGWSSTFGLYCEDAGGLNVLMYVSSLRLDQGGRSVVLDAAVVPLTNALVPLVMPMLGRGRMEVRHIKVSANELQLWKKLLLVWTERCRLERSWQHKSGNSCEYVAAGRVPASNKQGEDCLCACGQGCFPDGFFTHAGDFRAIARFATRAAISPIFFSLIVEDVFSPNKSAAGGNSDFEHNDDNDDDEGASDDSDTQQCKRCGKEGVIAPVGDDAASTSTSSGNLVKLRACGGCKKARYCSRGCQRADLKTHKQHCSGGK